MEDLSCWITTKTYYNRPRKMQILPRVAGRLLILLILSSSTFFQHWAVDGINYPNNCLNCLASDKNSLWCPNLDNFGPNVGTCCRSDTDKPVKYSLLCPDDDNLVTLPLTPTFGGFYSIDTQAIGVNQFMVMAKITITCNQCSKESTIFSVSISENERVLYVARSISEDTTSFSGLFSDPNFTYLKKWNPSTTAILVIVPPLPKDNTPSLQVKVSSVKFVFAPFPSLGLRPAPAQSSWDVGLQGALPRLSYSCSCSGKRTQFKCPYSSETGRCSCSSNIVAGIQLPYLATYFVSVDNLATFVPSPISTWIWRVPTLSTVSSVTVNAKSRTVTLTGSGFWDNTNQKFQLLLTYIPTVHPQKVTSVNYTLVDPAGTSITATIPVPQDTNDWAGRLCYRLWVPPVIAETADGPTVPTMPVQGSADTDCNANFSFSMQQSMFAIFLAVGIVGGLLLISLIIFLVVFIRRWKLRSKKYISLPQVISEKNLIVKDGEIKLGRKLGEGSFATVYIGKWEKRNQTVAVKQLRFTQSPEKTNEFVKEIETMLNLSHPNLVRLLGVINNLENLCIITEFMQLGSLSNLLKKRDLVIELEHVRNMALDTAKGMDYLHGLNIIHRDLKCANLLVDDSWLIKVGDFGLSRVADIEKTMTSCGTLSWAAPEVILQQRYTIKADIYSFAITLWEMLSRSTPYIDLQSYQVVLEVGINGKRPIIMDHMPDEFVEMMENCWATDPLARPPFTKIIDWLEDLNCPQPLKKVPYYKED